MLDLYHTTSGSPNRMVYAELKSKSVKNNYAIVMPGGNKLRVRGQKNKSFSIHYKSQKLVRETY